MTNNQKNTLLNLFDSESRDLSAAERDSIAAAIDEIERLRKWQKRAIERWPVYHERDNGGRPCHIRSMR